MGTNYIWFKTLPLPDNLISMLNPHVGIIKPDSKYSSGMKDNLSHPRFECQICFHSSPSNGMGTWSLVLALRHRSSHAKSINTGSTSSKGCIFLLEIPVVQLEY